MKVLATTTEIAKNDKVAMRHFFVLWAEFNREIDLTITGQPIPLRERVHLFGIYSGSWGREAY